MGQPKNSLWRSISVEKSLRVVLNLLFYLTELDTPPRSSSENRLDVAEDRMEEIRQRIGSGKMIWFAIIPESHTLTLLLLLLFLSRLA
jgi:hypothetical protein